MSKKLSKGLPLTDADLQPPKNKHHYVDNKVLLAEVIKHQQACVKAKKAGRSNPQMSDALGEMIFKIADHLSRRPNFLNYSWREDMVMEGVENCIRYISNFNPAKTRNPFGYFTQIAYYAFVRCITKEKKQTAVKYRVSQAAAVPEQTREQLPFLTATDNIAQFENIQTFLAQFEEGQERKAKQRSFAHKQRKSKEASGIDAFIEA